MKYKEPEYDVVIIGSGLVGLAAAIYCGRLELKTIVIGKEAGGTITKTDFVENYPGFKKITGQELADKLREHAKEYPVEIINENVEKISKCKEGCYTVYIENKHYHAQTILFATGSEWRKLGVSGEKEFTNKGVHYCALCDGPIYKDKVLAVSGGGDSAVKEALLLSKYATKVYILARSTLKPEPINMERIKKEPKIIVIEGTTIKEIFGNKFVNKIILDKKYKGKNELDVDGVFVSVGHIPLSDLAVKIGVKTNKNKEIIINKESKTNIKRVYAAGDVGDSRFKQAITGVGEAVKAVYSIYEDLKGERVVCSCVDEE